MTEYRVDEHPELGVVEFLGCTNGHCDIERPKGMHTNGGCHCLDSMDRGKRRKLREARARDRKRIAELEAKVADQQRRLDTALAGWG